jgi:hypothetical protein
MLPEAEEAEQFEGIALSVVVPTHNGGERIVTLAQRVADTLEGIAYELIFADDSDDDTPQQIMNLAKLDARIRLIHQDSAQRPGGLATAVVAAIRQSSGAYVAVLHMNAQHPPELLPKLLAVAKEADIVVASRYLPGGRNHDARGIYRRFASQGRRTIARILFRRVRACSDPLSGFFVFRRDVVQQVKLHPVSMEILLEILVRGKWSRLAEVPYHPVGYKRELDQADVNQENQYLRHLQTLVFKGKWGHGPVQYRRLGEETLMPPLNSVLDAERSTATAVEQAEATSSPSWRRIAIQATLLWLVSRGLLALLTYYSALFQLSAQASNAVITPDLLLKRWYQWDATNYIYIARHGYHIPVTTAFFPLYPLLIHLLTAVLGPGQEILAGMLISNLGTLAAFIGLGCLAAQEGYTSRVINQALLVLIAYPFAFFLAAPYTEGLFLALAIWTLLAARRGWWLLAIGCILIGSVTRPTGIVLVLPLLYEFGRQHGWWTWLVQGARQRDWGRLRRLPRAWSWRQAGIVLAIGAAVPLAYGIFALICATTFGDPLLFIKIHAHWNRVQMPIWTTLWRGLAWQGAIVVLHKGVWSYENARNLVDLMPVIIIGIITLCSVRRMPLSFTIYMLGLLYIAIDPPVKIGQNTVEFDSAGRFLLLSVPIFLLLGRWAARWAWLELLLVGGGFLLQAVFAGYYLAGGWLI